MGELIFNNRVITPNNTLNWGDLIPFHIIKQLSQSNKINENDVFNVKKPYDNYKIYSTGSVFNFTNPSSIVWGTGCIQPNAIGKPPKKIYSVRGPDTRNQLMKKGINCPEIYGDPALLYKYIYNPVNISKKYKYGVIPHYIDYNGDKNLTSIRNLESKGFKIIDICSGKNNFIKELLEVENVLSSSLHGLIAADTYNIPNARVRISNLLIGGDFKFIDYYKSVFREIDLGLQLTPETSISDIKKLYFNSTYNFDSEDYLEKSSPWIDNEYNLF